MARKAAARPTIHISDLGEFLSSAGRVHAKFVGSLWTPPRPPTSAPVSLLALSRPTHPPHRYSRSLEQGLYSVQRCKVRAFVHAPLSHPRCLPANRGPRSVRLPARAEKNVAGTPRPRSVHEARNHVRDRRLHRQPAQLARHQAARARAPCAGPCFAAFRVWVAQDRACHKRCAHGDEVFYIRLCHADSARATGVPNCSGF